MNIGLIGCGMISGAYLSTLEQYETANVVACADLNQEAANARARAYNLRKMDVDDLFIDPVTRTRRDFCDSRMAR